jgi:cytochrome c oxidase assembly protein subunit 15
LSAASYKPFLYRYAVFTACMAMVTVLFGTLTTSKNAGMAFRDWPTSDGYFMVTYPWYRDFAANWDKFLEHGHRLAGMLIGICSIGLVYVLQKYEPRLWLVRLGYVVLGCVILQGLLGGFRVRLDERGLAMIHGLFAACVLSLILTVSTALSRNWFNTDEFARGPTVQHLKAWAGMTVGAIFLQSILGGLIRHHGSGLHEHLGMGILVWGLIAMNAVVSHRAGARWVRRSGWMLFAIATSQVFLGAGAWVLKWGFKYTGFVGVADSIGQVSFRTAHAIVGMLTLAAAVVHLVRILRVNVFAPRIVWSAPTFKTAGGAA